MGYTTLQCYGNYDEQKVVRKPRSILIDPDAVHEALRSKKTLREWLEEAINEKIKRRPVGAGLSRVG